MLNTRVIRALVNAYDRTGNLHVKKAVKSALKFELGDVPQNIEDEVKAAYYEWDGCGHNKVAAIKRYRDLTNSSLKDSKEWVEKFFGIS